MLNRKPGPRMGSKTVHSYCNGIKYFDNLKSLESDAGSAVN